MKIGYLDCFAGCAGDMFLGALVGAGVPLRVLEEAVSALGIGAELRVEAVDRAGIQAVKVHVLDGSGGPAEEAHVHPHPEGVAQPGRGLAEIVRLIEAAALPEAVKRMAMRTFTLLGEAEAAVHGVPIEQIHFHEVGAVDAIVDIVASCAGFAFLGIARWHCSAVNVGSGTVVCAHGTLPVPAPAVAELLRGVPTYSALLAKELVTPTGAALLRMLQPAFGPQPVMVVDAVGYGAGTRNPAGFANVLRLSIGSAHDNLPAARDCGTPEVTVLETALDDLSPQVLAYAAEKLLAAGALDVMLGAVVMKKGRPGTLVTVLCDAAVADELVALLLRETSTLGVRRRVETRVCLERTHVPVETAYGTVRVKVGSEGGEVRNAAPEFRDCRAAAETHGVALKVVQAATMAAYLGRGEV